MKSLYIKSSPHFFRLILISMAIAVVLLLFLAAIYPAPLQEAGSISIVPNPVKSAWFLLWIQELVSYSKLAMYPLSIMAALFMALPWLVKREVKHAASWFPKNLRIVSTIFLIAVLAVLFLTIVATFFRGLNWSLISAF